MSETRPNVLKLWRCPECGMMLNGRSYNLDTSRIKCSKTWHKAAARSREFIDARSVIDTPEALDAAQGVIGPNVSRSVIRTALLDAMRAAANAPVSSSSRQEEKT